MKALFFDLGRTLLYTKEPLNVIIPIATQALTSELLAQGIRVDRDTFPNEYINRLKEYYTSREGSLREKSTFRLLQKLIAEKGLQDAPLSGLRAAQDAFYAQSQKNWHISDDTHPTLTTLKEKGYQLAIISNAGDDKDVQTLVDEHGLRPYFDLVYTSAGIGYRKPHSKIFEETLRALNLNPRQAVMVGDTLNADIKGANALGIYSVWINRYVNKNTKTLQDIHPKATIQSLSQLPQLMDGLD